MSKHDPLWRDQKWRAVNAVFIFNGLLFGAAHGAMDVAMNSWGQRSKKAWAAAPCQSFTRCSASGRGSARLAAMSLCVWKSHRFGILP